MRSLGEDILRPLRFMLALALLVLAWASTLEAQPACTRYASPTGGGNGLSQGSPYTIHDFIFGSPQPGAVLCLLDGTYTQDGIELGSTPSGAPGSPITVRALNDGGAFIDGQHNHRTLFFNGTSYWTIQGIDFGNAGGGDTDGASFYPGSHHITLQRVCIWNATTPVAGVYTNSHTIALWNSHDNFFEDICAFGWGRNTFIPFETDTKNNVFRRMWLRWDGYPDGAGAQCPGGTIQSQYHTYYTNDVHENLISIFSGGLYKTLYSGPGDPNHGSGFPCPSLGAGSGSRSGLLDNTQGAHYNGFIGYGYPDNNDILCGPDGVGDTCGIGFGGRWVPGYYQDIFTDNRAARENSHGLHLYACDTADPADPEAGSNYGHDCSLLRADRLTNIRNANQYAGVVAGTPTNVNDCTTLAACPNFYTGTSPATGSRACFEYQNGTLTSTPLWPWRMDDRIKQALQRSGIAPALTGNAGPGYAANTVTSEIVARYGAVPAQCSRAGAVAGVPAITSSLTVSGLVGTAFSYQITATNSPTSYGATGLPAGLSVNSSTGLISGTPTTAGTSSVTLSATNASGTGSATLTLTLTMASNITVREIPFGAVNTSGKTISSCWGGLGKDTSNRLYIAMGVGPSATADSDDVAIFQYTPVTGGAIGTRTFLDTLKHVTQLENNFDASETIAKVHTTMLPLDGKLYFASHDFHDVGPGYHRGGHFFSYDPAANHFEDLSKTDPGGVSAPGEGIIGMDIMLPQKKLIGFTYKPGDGGNVVSYDVAAHSSVFWAGNPNPDGGVSRHIFTSHDLLAYISYGSSGGPQQIYAMNVTNGAITAPAGMTLRTAQIPAVAAASDGDRVFLANWDAVYLWHTTSKTLDPLIELLPPGDRGRNLTAQNLVLSQDESKLYAIAEGYLDSGSTYVWRLYQLDVATHASVLLADLTSQMAGINGGRVGSSLGAVLDAQGRMYTCSAEVGLLLEISGLPSTAPPTPQGAWWKFDENTGTTAADSTGNNHTITLNAGAGWTAPGRIGPAALHCLGQTQPPSVTDVGFASGNYTWMGWFKGDSAPVNTSFNAPMANGPTNVGTDAWGLWWSAQGSPDPSGSIFHRDASGLNLFKLSPALQANTWYHLAASFDGSTLRSYMNGQVKGTVGVGAPVTPSGPLQVCGRYFLTPWAGNIDQLKVTDHALSDAEILAEFQQGSQAPTQRRHRRIVP
jgi:Concanavalin A-like lectin/glucanases superfamily/Putative Ig domain